MSNIWESVQSLWRRPKPEPVPAPEAEETEKNIPWVRVGVLLRSIPFKKLLPVIISVPTILFFTISGFVAWLVVLAKFVTSLFNT